jgi:hypothetical protein
MPIRIPDPSSGGIVRVTHFFDSGKCIIQLFCRNLFLPDVLLAFLKSPIRHLSLSIYSVSERESSTRPILPPWNGGGGGGIRIHTIPYSMDTDPNQLINPYEIVDTVTRLNFRHFLFHCSYSMFNIYFPTIDWFPLYTSTCPLEQVWCFTSYRTFGVSYTTLSFNFRFLNLFYIKSPILFPSQGIFRPLAFFCQGASYFHGIVFKS